MNSLILGVQSEIVEMVGLVGDGECIHIFADGTLTKGSGFNTTSYEEDVDPLYVGYLDLDESRVRFYPIERGCVGTNESGAVLF